MTQWVGIGIIGALLLLACVLLLFLIPQLMKEARAGRKAREDFMLCRGTQHARQLKEALDHHQQALAPVVTEKKQAAAKLEKLGDREREELSRVLETHLVDTQFTEIPGIGPTLKNRIMQSCFRGSLDDLLTTSGVQGVGEERAAAIRRWVYRWKQEMPRLLEREFPGRRPIVEAYQSRRKELNEQLKRLQRAISIRQEVITTASVELAKLEGVGVQDFRFALLGDHEAAERVGTYTVGAFAAWAKPPAWFVKTMREPGEDAGGA